MTAVELGAGATGVAGLAAAKFGGAHSKVALAGLSDVLDWYTLLIV